MAQNFEPCIIRIAGNQKEKADGKQRGNRGSMGLL